MKKIISILTVVVMLSSILSFTSVSASENTLTKEQAEKVFLEAMAGFTRIQGTTMNMRRLNSDYTELKILEADKIKADSDTQGSYFEFAMDGTEYNSSIGKRFDYIEVTDPRLDTMEKCYAYAEQWFEDDLAKYVVDVNGYAYFRSLGEKYPCLRTSDGGYRNNAPLEAGKIMKSYTHQPADPIFYLESIEGFTQNGDTATLQIKYSVTQMRWKDIDVPDCAVSSSDVQPSPLHPDKVYYAYYKMELTKDVVLTNTSDGWKVSGGSFIDTILFKESALEDWMYGQDTRYHPITGKDMWNPNTGDETAILVTLLALSGLAVAFVPRKRRKF